MATVTKRLRFRQVALSADVKVVDLWYFRLLAVSVLVGVSASAALSRWLYSVVRGTGITVGLLYTRTAPSAGGTTLCVPLGLSVSRFGIGLKSCGVRAG